MIFFRSKLLLIILILWSLSNFRVFSQTVISGKFLFLSDTITVVYLYERIGSKHNKIDSVEVLNSAFQFRKIKYPAGYYVLSVSDSNHVEIIINKEKKIELSFSEPVLKSAMQVKESVENKALWGYKNFSKTIMVQQQQLLAQKKLLQGADSSAILILDKYIDSLQTIKQEFLKQHMTKFPGTFFSRSVKSSLLPDIPSEDLKNEAYFAMVDWSDEELIRSRVFTNKIMEYLQYRTEYSEAGFMNSVDLILALSRANEKVFAHCLDHLLELFNRVGPPVIFQYLVENYLYEEGCSELSPEESYKAVADAYKSVMPGNKSPDFEIPDVLGNSVSLSEEVKKHKVTLLFFWSSYCHFCHEAVPKIKDLYDKYYPAGFDIIGISMDTDGKEWLTAVHEKELKWLNVSQLKGWKSPVVSDFKVHKTPYFYLVNSDMVIVSKPKSYESLEHDLVNYLSGSGSSDE